MAGPENASFEPNSTEMPANYDPVEGVCYDLMDDAVAEAGKAIDQAAKAGQGSPDAGGSEKKDQKEPEVKDEEPEVQEEQPEIDPEVQELLDKFSPRISGMILKMLTTESEKYDQQIVATILNNPQEYNDIRPFAMAERVAFYMKNPKQTPTDDRSKAIIKEAVRAFDHLKQLRGSLLANKASIITDAQAYEGQELKPVDLTKVSNGLALAHIKQMYPDQTYEQCFEDFLGLKMANRLTAATNTAWSYGELG